jgi:hypothetical protein
VDGRKNTTSAKWLRLDVDGLWRAAIDRHHNYAQQRRTFTTTIFFCFLFFFLLLLLLLLRQYLKTSTSQHRHYCCCGVVRQTMTIDRPITVPLRASSNVDGAHGDNRFGRHEHVGAARKLLAMHARLARICFAIVIANRRQTHTKY